MFQFKLKRYIKASFKSCKIALFINFETTKAAIKPESQFILKNIATMLTDNFSLTISIEGHTQADNTGSSRSEQNIIGATYQSCNE